MTVAVSAMAKVSAEAPARLRQYCVQAAVVLLIHIPVVSSGLSLGWVSLASGEGGEGAGGAVVGGAALTFAAALVGVPLSARALAAGRRRAVVCTSAAFLVCWMLSLSSAGWCAVGARAAAGLGGAGAWAQAPLLAQEMCSARMRGPAAAGAVAAHNLGFLLMYSAAAARVPQRTVVWWCAALSAVHCVVYMFMPESPAYLAGNGRLEEARVALARLRGVGRHSAALADELAALPLPDLAPISPLQLARDMLSVRCRRRAFVIAAVAVIGQEMCGILTLLQFAERVFVMARDGDSPTTTGRTTPGAEGNSSTGNGTAGQEDLAGLQATAGSQGELPGLHRTTLVPDGSGSIGNGTTGQEDSAPVQFSAGWQAWSPAGRALLLGAAQLLASLAALYLVERVGRRRLFIWSALVTGAALGAGAVIWWCGAEAGGAALAGTLALAVAADSAGLQPAPYALLGDLFDYQYRGCATALITAGACGANALEVLALAALSALAGGGAALAASAIVTLALAAFAVVCVPETRGRPLQQVYRELCASEPCAAHAGTQCCDQTDCTKV